jgi:hypothetical protein
LADGKVHPNVTVSTAGTITLNYAASTVHVGLGYGGRLQMPRPESPQPDGTSQGKKKAIRKVACRVIDTNNLKFGADFTTMTRINFRKTTDPIDAAVPLFTGDKIFDFAPPPADTDGTICLENDYPYPFCVAGVFPTVEVF